MYLFIDLSLTIYLDSSKHLMIKIFLASVNWINKNIQQCCTFSAGIFSLYQEIKKRDQEIKLIKMQKSF